MVKLGGKCDFQGRKQEIKSNTLVYMQIAGNFADKKQDTTVTQPRV